jgi:hypothetical protein
MVGSAVVLAEELMAEKRYGVPVTVRIPAELAKRLDRLKPKVGKDPTLTTFGRVSRSSIVKLALLRGVAALEAEYR